MGGVATLRLGECELVPRAGEGVPAVTDPVGPRQQQLTTPGRATCVRRVSGQHVPSAKCVGTQAAPDLDHDCLVITMSDGPLLTAGKDAHIGKIRDAVLVAR